MLKKKPDKKISFLDPSFENILVCNNKKLRPYIEVIVREPEHINQQELGTLLVVFEITDISEDSSYVVNYLLSIIKKEYFSKPKRPAIESFEASLHKANLALSSLAEHGSIGWLGKLNGIVAVIEKNNLHLSQTGTASALLLRSNLLTNVSEGLAENEAAPNPLKTFVNVSSGKIENGDKIIIATEGIFEIFSLEEIKKSALRFDNEKFIQFLKTALGNELEKAAVLVADVKEKQMAAVPAAPKKSDELNAFSQSSFAKKSPVSEEKAEKDLQDEIDSGKKTANEKTGHIYIKESDHLVPEEILLERYAKIASEKLNLCYRGTVKFFKNRIKNLRRKIAEIKLPEFNLNLIREKKERSDSAKQKIEITSENKALAFIKIVRNFSTVKNFKILKTLPEKIRKHPKISSLKILPSFSRIKKIAAGFDYQQRLYAILIILAIIILPAIALKIENYIRTKNEKPAEATVPAALPLENDKNVVRVNNIKTVYSGNSLIKPIALNGKIYLIAKNQIIDMASSENFSTPQEFGEIVMVAGMDDLNLLFIINAKSQVISFSPTSKKFQNNNISIPENSSISSAGTYLTYLYLIDSSKNQIYRYPRAEGGFGEKTDWLKESINLSDAKESAIDENIYIIQNSNVLKLFRGKKQNFSLEKTATEIEPYDIYASPDIQNFYVLDKRNARIVKLNKEGKIISQYYNAEISEAISFTVDEKLETVYFSTENKLRSFGLHF